MKELEIVVETKVEIKVSSLFKIKHFKKRLKERQTLVLHRYMISYISITMELNKTATRLDPWESGCETTKESQEG